MRSISMSRRRFVSGTASLVGAGIASASVMRRTMFASVSAPQNQIVDYELRIQASTMEIAPKRIVSAITYDGHFPGPLLRFKEGRQITVDIFNDTDTPEQLHWHGQRVGVDVDGAAEEGTPFIPAHGRRRISFIP